MTLQYLLQCYLQAYALQRKWSKKFLIKKSWYPFIVALVLYLAVIVISTSCSTRLRTRPGIYVPLYVFFSFLQAIYCVALNLAIPKMSVKGPAIVSLMSTCICVAFSLYTCCLKDQFTLCRSRVSALLVLAGASGVAYALYSDQVIYVVGGAIYQVLWTLLISLNITGMQRDMKRTEGIYSAFVVQSDFKVLFQACKQRCSREKTTSEEQEQEETK